MKPGYLKTVLAVSLAALAGAALWYFSGLRHRADADDPALTADLKSIAADFRRVVVLADGIDRAADDAVRARLTGAGRLIFRRETDATDRIAARIASDPAGPATRQLERFVSADPSLREADRLAYLGLVEQAETANSKPEARTELGGRLRTLLDSVQATQLAYRDEVSKVFAAFATRGAAPVREKWDTYVAFLKQSSSADKIVAELGDSIPEEYVPDATRGASNEIFGNEFATKTVALTFDDGPHPRYSEQVLALLRKYGLKAVFFELGTNLGSVAPDGSVKLYPTSEVARKILADGHVIANHTYSHRVLPKLSEAERASEIDRTDVLLSRIVGQRTQLFRAPYGARNKEILDKVQADGLRSVMWTIDSLDWADPIPESIAQRVFKALAEKQKGIILFHDIHKQSVMALSPVIEELQRQQYTFLNYQDGSFVKTTAPPDPQRSPDPDPTAGPPATPAVSSTATATASKYYHDSWAVVVGINDYQRWPKLRYAVHDATAVRDILVSKYGFKPENIRTLTNADATRQRIMQVLGDEFSDGRKIKRDDRVFFFFAGHGATRTLEDGRQLGFIVPVDADPGNYYSTAIRMTALREASDLIPAKHIYFVMDSCYSGLAMTRAAGMFSGDNSYLDEISRRAARQILTAGGANQQVADDGPDGHSVFTWALLQGLQGQADLDGNGVITASELGAYVSPIVSQFARQTPAVGNLVGSEGGEFLFELQPEPLTSMTKQQDRKAMELNQTLVGLEKEIAAKQKQLLALQASIQSESARLGAAPQLVASRAPQTADKSKSARAYAFDRSGLQHYRAKEYAEAEKDFRAAVDLKPGDAVLLNNLGFLYYTMGRYDDALAYLNRTLAADPNRREAHGNIAELLMKLGRRDEARTHAQRYLALYPNSPKAAEFQQIISAAP
jgi:peptidoglycan/xylan/chitin deacetylase (PgdA/CDA1 family)/uncharacterized caspase-like protein